MELLFANEVIFLLVIARAVIIEMNNIETFLYIHSRERICRLPGFRAFKKFLNSRCFAKVIVAYGKN